jgi:hypothetical protein
MELNNNNNQIITQHPTNFVFTEVDRKKFVNPFIDYRVTKDIFFTIIYKAFFEEKTLDLKTLLQLATFNKELYLLIRSDLFWDQIIQERWCNPKTRWIERPNACINWNPNVKKFAEKLVPDKKRKFLEDSFTDQPHLEWHLADEEERIFHPEKKVFELDEKTGKLVEKRKVCEVGKLFFSIFFFNLTTSFILARNCKNFWRGWLRWHEKFSGKKNCTLKIREIQNGVESLIFCSWFFYHGDGWIFSGSQFSGSQNFNCYNNAYCHFNHTFDSVLFGDGWIFSGSQFSGSQNFNCYNNAYCHFNHTFDSVLFGIVCSICGRLFSGKQNDFCFHASYKSLFSHSNGSCHWLHSKYKFYSFHNPPCCCLNCSRPYSGKKKDCLFEGKYSDLHNFHIGLAFLHIFPQICWKCGLWFSGKKKRCLFKGTNCWHDYLIFLGNCSLVTHSTSKHYLHTAMFFHVHLCSYCSRPYSGKLYDFCLIEDKYNDDHFYHYYSPCYYCGSNTGMNEEKCYVYARLQLIHCEHLFQRYCDCPPLKSTGKLPECNCVLRAKLWRNHFNHSFRGRCLNILCPRRFAGNDCFTPKMLQHLSLKNRFMYYLRSFPFDVSNSWIAYFAGKHCEIPPLLTHYTRWAYNSICYYKYLSCIDHWSLVVKKGKRKRKPCKLSENHDNRHHFHFFLLIPNDPIFDRHCPWCKKLNNFPQGKRSLSCAFLSTKIKAILLENPGIFSLGFCTGNRNLPKTKCGCYGCLGIDCCICFRTDYIRFTGKRRWVPPIRYNCGCRYCTDIRCCGCYNTPRFTGKANLVKRDCGCYKCVSIHCCMCHRNRFISGKTLPNYLPLRFGFVCGCGGCFDIRCCICSLFLGKEEDCCCYVCKLKRKEIYPSTIFKDEVKKFLNLLPLKDLTMKHVNYKDAFLLYLKWKTFEVVGMNGVTDSPSKCFEYITDTVEGYFPHLIKLDENGSKFPTEKFAQAVFFLHTGVTQTPIELKVTLENEEVSSEDSDSSADYESTLSDVE